jgi:hypothetical protein
MNGNRIIASSVASKLRSRIFATATFAAVMLIYGCRQDMQDQPKIIPQRGTEFYPDHRGARQQVADTVARGQLNEDRYFYTGLVHMANGKDEERDLLPFPVTIEVLKRGQERFNIYCSPCHSRVGNGLGAVVQRGYKQAANFHDKARMSQPISHYFYVMSNGFGAMPNYGSQLAPADRWAIAAYIRVLQRSQTASVSDVPAGAIVKSMKDLAQEKHLPAEYAEPWTLPQTVIQAYPRDASQGYPAMAPAYPVGQAIKIPQGTAHATRK